MQHSRLIRRQFGLVTVLAAGLSAAGCGSPKPEGPQLGPVGQMERPDPAKPLPSQDVADVRSYDPPVVYERPPEQKLFLEAYNAVGRPRLAVFVNRSLLGDALPADAPAVAERVPPSGVDPIRGNPFREDPAAGQTYLRPGQYDENYARQIDYAAVENVLTQWLACEGQTTIASPSVVRERLNTDEIVRLQAGRPRQVGELAKELNADVLVYVQARPVRQTEHGLEIRLNAEAINIAHGEQIARASLLIPPPLDAEQMHQHTRVVARKLMADMTMTWSGPPPTRPQASGAAAIPAIPAPPPTVVPAEPVKPKPPAPVEVEPSPGEAKPAEIKPAEVKPSTRQADPKPEPAKPSEPKAAEPKASEPKASEPKPGGERAPVPPEKPSVLDRTEPPSATRQPESDFPPPPASARRMPE